ncbi:sulfur oxidation c-type cytochrome SoxA [Sinimarinibacterium thermocellulolyticum]|uniref:SoxAX cytochrome complex subunit A n=1 Tax=Sinimarinibacterium thermocellulolyticum TaxID=3170016 RepID=A0ABV2ABU0_9GAMM
MRTSSPEPERRPIARLLWAVVSLLISAAPNVGSAAQPEPEQDPIAEYRAMFGDDNPAVFWEMRGEALWTTPRGPKNRSLEDCDLGLGKGVVRGAYAQLPRYFADTGQVQDLESRLVTCVERLQGIDRATLLKVRFGNGEAHRSDMEALAAYVAAQSRGATLSVPLTHPQEKAAYALGEHIFYYRAGPHDFACATCHAADGKRIRLQKLPNLTRADDARAAYTTWPAYRISQGELRTMQWRLNDCFRQQRLPDLIYGSEVSIALTMFLAKKAEGGVIDAPGLKR